MEGMQENNVLERLKAQLQAQRHVEAPRVEVVEPEIRTGTGYAGSPLARGIQDAEPCSEERG